MLNFNYTEDVTYRDITSPEGEIQEGIWLLYQHFYVVVTRKHVCTLGVGDRLLVESESSQAFTTTTGITKMAP